MMIGNGVKSSGVCALETRVLGDREAVAAKRFALTESSPFHRLAGMPAVRAFLQAFRQATGVPVRLERSVPTEAMLDRNRTVPARFYEMSVPVQPGDTPLAILVAGPILCADGDQSHLVRKGGGLPALPVLTEDQREGIRQLLAVYAIDLGAIYNRQVLLTVATEPPCIQRAREYVRTHAHEPIRVSEIAKHVHFCADHFGRIFRKATGLTMTDYIAHLRVEKAKELLADRNCRVTDAAFASGFQSLPTFNRVFRRVTGRSAKEWRAAIESGH